MPAPDLEGGESAVSFQLGATVTKATEIKKALESQRDQQLGDIPDAKATQGDDNATAANDRRRVEIDTLTDAGVAMAEAGLRKIKGAGTFQVRVEGHRSPDDENPQQSVVVSVNALP